MANRFPLVLDTTDGNKIKEIPAGDNLDLRNVSISDVQNITALGTINAASVQINGEELKAGEFLDLTDVPNSYTGFEGYLIKVKDDGTGLEFTTLGAGGADFAVNDILLEGDIIPDQLNVSNIGSNEKRLAQVHSQFFQGSLKGFDGSTVFDATSNQIPYAVIAGAPQVVSDLTNDADYITRDELTDGTITVEVSNTGNLIGSVFGEDSTLLVDHINSRINAARLTQNGAADGQTIVWNASTEVWEPGIAGDITGLSSNKVDTLTVEAGYKFTFGDNPGLIEADGLSITTTTDPVTFDADVELADTKTFVPATNGQGSVGTASARFGNGYFDNLDVTTLSGNLSGNAATATALQTPITIAGVSFDGTANIDIAATDLSDTDQSLATTSDVEFNSVTGPIVTSSITGTTINITPSSEIVAGNMELTDDIYPDTNATGKVGTSSLKFAEGNFVTVNSDSISVSSFSTTSITTEDLEVTGTGVGEITSGTDLVFTAGNRSRFAGGPVKLTNADQATINGFVEQSGDTLYNTSANKFQFYENGSWVQLHRGTFEGDLIGSVFADDSSVLFDAGDGKIIQPTVSGLATFENNVTIQGNLTVQGSTTTIDTVDTTIKDNLIVLNDGEPGAGVTAGLSGIQIDRGSEANVSFFWDEANDKWSIGVQTFTAETLLGTGGGDINQFTNINGDGGGDINQFTNINGDGGGDITQFTNITGDGGGTISQFTTLTGDGGGNITQFTNITGDGGGTVSAFTNITGDGGGTISAFTNITGDGGGTISAFTNITGDGGGTISQFNFSGDLTGNVVGNVTGNTTGYHTGDVTGSVFADDSSIIVDAVNGVLIGDLTGSVYADDSTQLVDGVAGKVVGPYDNGVVSINPTNVTTYDIFVQQDANINDLYVANRIYGGATGDAKNVRIASTAPANSTGADGDRAGMIAFDATSIYYCIADWASPGSANIWVKQDWGTTGAW